MKSILMSMQPYWGFLIIAKEKGWDLKKYGLHEKTVEVRKRVPTSPDWDKKVALYFSKDKKSLARIPEEYRGEVAKLCGKVVGEFVCDEVIDFISSVEGVAICKIDAGKVAFLDNPIRAIKATCLSVSEIKDYLVNEDGYGWHISDLKIYDKPKELSEFIQMCSGLCADPAKGYICPSYYKENRLIDCKHKKIVERPPQSWQYVEEQGVEE